MQMLHSINPAVCSLLAKHVESGVALERLVIISTHLLTLCLRWAQNTDVVPAGIKANQSKHYKQRNRPVRRKRENKSPVHLPSDWSSFMAPDGNVAVANLAVPLSNHLIEHRPTYKPVVVVARGSPKQPLSLSDI